MPTLPELALILAIMLVVFGANRLPAVGDALGRAVTRGLAALRRDRRAARPRDARSGERR